MELESICTDDDMRGGVPSESESETPSTKRSALPPINSSPFKPNTIPIVSIAELTLAVRATTAKEAWTPSTEKKTHL